MARSQNAQAVAGVKQVPKDLGKAQNLSFTLGPWVIGSTPGRRMGETALQAVFISTPLFS